jgi:HipA-like protein
MDYNDTPANSTGVFHLKYQDMLIGILKYENKNWIFTYSDEYKQKPLITPILNFPDPNKVYKNDQLWPFFASRIPTLNQPFHYKKIAKAKISKDDSVGLLKVFGSETITNPFKLQAL